MYIHTFFLLCLVFVAVPAQDFFGPEKPFTKDRLTNGSTVLGMNTATSPSLLDPARFSMHQSYSMSYVSSGGNGDMTGLYLNRLQYDFSAPVTLLVDVGFFHKPLSLLEGGKDKSDGQNQTLTIPRVGLFYQPTKNLSMSFQYFHTPAGYGLVTDPFSTNPFGFSDFRHRESLESSGR
ncbi:MAG: hypothetical protein A2293_00030 [Elusimicrobia bacterium RIFOXYB2_FULL_49_7]|nr:MAG: hypothetical protein A2293_00030 [Elusimicrobia bacterium RIFOXYB2_FULL_49_7]